MRKKSSRQLFAFALALLALCASTLHGQFHNLYHYTGPVNENGGIFKDVQCLETAGPNGERIVTVGSDNRVPVNGLLAFHDGAGVPLRYVLLSNTLGHIMDAAAICNTPRNRIVACYFDPVDKASDIVCTDNTGNVLWMTRIPDFRVHDVVAGAGGVLQTDTVWVTGHTTLQAPNVGVVALTAAAGALLYYNVYQIAQPYSNTIGFEIDYNPGPDRLTVAGKTSIANCPDGMLILRLRSSNGAVVWGNVYRAPNCNYDLKAKALVRTPGAFNQYVIAFEYKDPLIAGAAYPGLTEIDPAGALIAPTHFTTGAGFFNGSGYSVDGLDTDGDGYLATGTFRNGTNGQVSGYSLHSNNARNSVQFNEYETTDAYSPAETRLVDLDYFAAQGQYLLGGHYRAAPGTAWPLWPTDVAFWLISANPDGSSDCSTDNDPTDVDIDPDTAVPTLQIVTNDLDQSPLGYVDVDMGYFNQCAIAKRASLQATQAEGPNTAVLAYQDGSGQMVVRIPGEAKGQVDVTLVDLQGRVLARMALPAGEHHLTTLPLRAGVYFLRFQGGGLPDNVLKMAVH